MNLPNRLTLLRAVLVPVFLVFLLMKAIPMNYMIALVIFIAASITDALDGHIARKNNLVTNFGKFLDPLADKVLVISAMTAFIELNIVKSVPVIIIIAREFMVSALRLVASKSGEVIAAGFWGKLKTAFTMVAIIVILANLTVSENLGWFGFEIGRVENVIDISIQVLVWVAAALTVISGYIYLKNSGDLINSDM